MQSEDTFSIKESDNEIANDKLDVRKVTESEALVSVNTVKRFTKTHGDKQMNVMLNKFRIYENTQVTKRSKMYYPYGF